MSINRNKEHEVTPKRLVCTGVWLSVAMKASVAEACVGESYPMPVEVDSALLAQELWRF